MKEFFVSFFLKKVMLSPRKSCYNFLNSHAEQTWASQVVLVIKNPPASAGDKRSWFDPWVRKIPWRRKWQATPLGETHGGLQSIGWQRVGHD